MTPSNPIFIFYGYIVHENLGGDINIKRHGSVTEAIPKGILFRTSPCPIYSTDHKKIFSEPLRTVKQILSPAIVPVMPR